ncbi:MAG: hypothetical protein KGI51_01625 [Rhodospirillales bacterium]|nr:hypothetical protein [Rhodospirillales bacterium]
MKPAPPKRVGPEEIRQIFPNLPTPYQVKTFYAAVGQAIAAWQNVEAALYEVYRASTGARRPGAEAAAFFAVASARAKLTLTSAAVEFAALGEPEALKGWSALRNRVGKKTNRRNDIAHAAVWILFHEKRRERKIYLGPNAMDTRGATRKGGSQDTEPLTLKRLQAYENDFRELAADLLNFARNIPPP